MIIEKWQVNAHDFVIFAKLCALTLVFPNPLLYYDIFRTAAFFQMLSLQNLR